MIVTFVSGNLKIYAGKKLAFKTSGFYFSE